MARLERGRSSMFVEQDSQEDEEQGGGGKGDEASPEEPSGEHPDSEDDIMS